MEVVYLQVEEVEEVLDDWTVEAWACVVPIVVLEASLRVEVRGVPTWLLLSVVSTSLVPDDICPQGPLSPNP